MIETPLWDVTADLGGVDGIADRLLSLRTGRDVFLFEGEMGRGKTELARSMAKRLGLRETASPSYALHQRSIRPDGESFDHWDLFRLESEDDLESTGFWDQFSEDRGLIVIEWSSMLNVEYLPGGWALWRVRIEEAQASGRRYRADRLSRSS